jgi:dGTPase
MGKTQLFPSDENDFFRNRLTHSLEVAQIASSIARRINRTNNFYKKYPINERLCELAALAHDIGHPPFGHNGELSLNGLMNGSGGFEGNAQTLRILSKLEKKDLIGDDFDKPIISSAHGAVDNRLGLDLCARSMASILKYDRLIPPSASDDCKVIKGYYYDDEDSIDFLKEAIGTPEDGVSFKTIECSIMDISDDIAYSVYDLEDAFKAGFWNPSLMLAADSDFKADVANTVRERAERYYPERRKKWKDFSESDVDSVLQDVFAEVLDVEIGQNQVAGPFSREQIARINGEVHAASSLWSGDGYYRTALTSYLIGRFVESVSVEYKTRGNNPIFWNARLQFDDFLCVEVLKTYAYKSLIMSSFLKLSEYRGRDIVKSLYLAMNDGEGVLMMPPDIRRLCNLAGDSPFKRRIISDFIASMTDRYAIEFYRRLVGTNAPSIFKPY